MNLKTEQKRSEYPADFLVARLKGRRAHFRIDWDLLRKDTDPARRLRNTPAGTFLAEHGPNGAWLHLVDEYLWVYQRMNGRLRKIFRHYFFFMAWQFLLVCLRLRLGGELSDAIVKGFMPLLDRKLSQTLQTAESFEKVLDQIQHYLISLSEAFPDLPSAFQRGGYQEMEQLFFTSMVEYLKSQKPHPSLKFLFANLISIRNCLILCKTLRWQELEEPPRFLSGGTVAVKHFRKALETKDTEQISKLSGFSLDCGKENQGTLLESLMFDELASALKKNIHESSGVAFLVFYLWERFCWCREISILMHTTEAA